MSSVSNSQIGNVKKSYYNPHIFQHFSPTHREDKSTLREDIKNRTCILSWAVH